MGKKVTNWVCYTVLFSLLPLIIYLVTYSIDARGVQFCFFALSSNLLLSALVLSIGTIQAMKDYNMIGKNKKFYYNVIFTLLFFIIILSSLIYGIIRFNEAVYASTYGVQDVNLIEENVLTLSIIFTVSSFFIGTLIQILQQMSIYSRIRRTAKK